MNSEFVEPDWDPTYVRMLDAVIEYMDNIGDRDDPKINARDINIIRALIEFYDFEVLDNQDILDVMDDVKVRADQLKTEEDDECH
jgi:hypothetical protein